MTPRAMARLKCSSNHQAFPMDRHPTSRPNRRTISQRNKVMPTKMDRFDPRARRVLSLAQNEAIRMRRSGEIGLEHLLLALTLEENGVAGQALRDLGLHWWRVEQYIRMTSNTP